MHKNAWVDGCWRRMAFCAVGSALMVVGCGNEGGSSTAPNPTDREEPALTAEEVDTAWTVALYDATFDVKTGEIKLSPVLGGAGSDVPGMFPMSHQQVPIADGGADNTPNRVQVITEPGASAPNTTCGGFSNSFCAPVSLRSKFTRRLSLTWVEIQNLPSGVTVRNPDPIPTALAGYVTGPAFNYAALMPSQKVTKQWVFGVPNSNNFTFRIAIKAAPPRLAYGVTVRTGLFVNACTAGGSQIIGPDDVSSNVSINLPFPVTIYDTADVFGRVSTRGVFSLAQQDRPIGSTGAPLPSNYIPRGAVAAFWETLRTRPVATPPSGRVCRYSYGTRPNRDLWITWENMRFQGDTGTQVMTFSARFLEALDSIQIYYNRMGNPTVPDDRTRGAKASVGLQGWVNEALPCNDANACKQLFLKTPFLPADPAQYPRHYTFTP